MKKFSLSLLAAAGLVFTSCSSDEPAANVVDNGGLVTFNVAVPGSINSRSISDGTTVDDLHYVIFDESGNVVEEFKKKDAFAGNVLSTQVQIQLVNGKTYKIAFWAQNAEAPYTFDGGTVTVDYTDGKKAANNEARDAFYGTYGPFLCTSTFQPDGDIVLTRPFAQVNVGTADWSTVTTHDAAPTQTAMSFTATVASTLNLVDGTVADLTEVDFDMAALPADNILTVKWADDTTENYTWIGMNYILVPETKEIVTTVKFKYDYANGEVAFNQVPVQRNYRTNIVGNILTSTSDWRIVIDKEFNTPDYNLTHNLPVVSTLEELLAAAGSGTVVLKGEIDMSYATTSAIEVPEGKELRVIGAGDGAVIKGYGKSVSNDGQGIQVLVKGGNVYFENVTFEVPEITPSYPGWAMSCLISNGKVTFKNCKFKGVQCPIYQANTGVVVLDGCDFQVSSVVLQGETYLPNCFRESDWTITNCNFNDCEGVWHVYDGAAAITADTLIDILKAGNNIWNNENTWENAGEAVKATNLPANP